MICPSCGGEMYDAGKYRVVNPNGEFVEGYGHARVMVKSGESWTCRHCGWYDGASLKHITLDGNEVLREVTK